MKKLCPKIMKNSENLLVGLQELKSAKKIENINFTLDIDPQDNEVVGIEIINLKGQVGNYRLENYRGLMDGLNWSITYDSNDDVAYIGFRSAQVPKTKTKQLRGSVLVSGDQVVGFECEAQK